MTVMERVVEHATCLGCGCACDDIRVVVRNERIAEASGACPLGAAWFGDGRVPARALVGGRDSSIDAALGTAAARLADALHPLIYLAPDLSCEAQREGVALADALGATLDSVTSATAMRPILAAQERGRASATLGEIRHRADLLVCWGVDPSLRYPRYRSRYAPPPRSLSMSGGTAPCSVMAVDVGASRGPEDADGRVAVEPPDEIAALTALASVVGTARANHGTSLQAGRPLQARPADGADPESVTRGLADRRRRRAGIESMVRELAPVLLAARYAVLVADSEPDPLAADRDAYRADALIALAQALYGSTRAALSLLRAGGNRSGADAVTTWQTGYPLAVDFARGYPRYRPHDGTAQARLARGETDAVLLIGSVALVPPAVVSAMARAAGVVTIGPRASESGLAGEAAAIDTGVAGIHEGGTALRMDDVPLPLRASMTGPPDTVAIVRALRERIVAGRRYAGRSS